MAGTARAQACTVDVFQPQKNRLETGTQRHPALQAPPGASVLPPPQPLCLAPQADPPLHLPSSHRPAQRGDPGCPRPISVLAVP